MPVAGFPVAFSTIVPCSFTSRRPAFFADAAVKASSHAGPCGHAATVFLNCPDLYRATSSGGSSPSASAAVDASST
jgi:hypothetical protein